MAREYLSLTELYERLRSELPGLDLADLGAHVRTNGFPRERRKGRLHYGLTDADIDGLRAHFSPGEPSARPVPPAPPAPHAEPPGGPAPSSPAPLSPAPEPAPVQALPSPPPPAQAAAPPAPLAPEPPLAPGASLLLATIPGQAPTAPPVPAIEQAEAPPANSWQPTLHPWRREGAKYNESQEDSVFSGIIAYHAGRLKRRVTDAEVLAVAIRMGYAQSPEDAQGKPDFLAAVERYRTLAKGSQLAAVEHLHLLHQLGYRRGPSERAGALAESPQPHLRDQRIGTMRTISLAAFVANNNLPPSPAYARLLAIHAEDVHRVAGPEGPVPVYTLPEGEYQAVLAAARDPAMRRRFSDRPVQSSPGPQHPRPASNGPLLYPPRASEARPTDMLYEGPFHDFAAQFAAVCSNGELRRALLQRGAINRNTVRITRRIAQELAADGLIVDRGYRE